VVRYVKMAARNVDTTLLEDATRRGESCFPFSAAPIGVARVTLFEDEDRANGVRSKRRQEII
jgi:hypothetical protein